MPLYHEIWRTEFEGPSNVCPICEPLDGLVDDEWRERVGGQNGPPIHVNCACGIELVAREAGELVAGS